MARLRAQAPEQIVLDDFGQILCPAALNVLITVTSTYTA